jgi:hypothetical protein
MSEVLYVYGFVPGDGEVPEDLEGIGGSRVEVIDLGVDFRSVASRVSAERYAPERVEAKLEDLRWVAEQGVAHERVVAWFVDHGEIVPVPLFTFYSGPDALREEAVERETEIRARIARFGGRREWDLKVAYRADVVIEHAGELSAAVGALDAEIAASPPGRQYLLQRKRTELAREEVAAVTRRIARELLDAVRPLVEEVVQLPLPRADHELPVVMNAALLVPKENERPLVASLEARAHTLGGLGVYANFSGPWAPYRFIGDEV